MQIRKFIFPLLVFLFIASETNAQFQTTDSLKTVQKIAVFAPLYLDSAFDNNHNYRYSRSEFPKFINPGLEFYEGIQLALDSLQQEGVNLEVHVFDTRSKKETIQEQLYRTEIQDAGLIIAYCSGNELRSLADAARSKNIPVINVNIPNDGGAANNPNFVVLNPTLITQCEGIHNYLTKKYPGKEIVVYRRAGTADNPIKSIFTNYNEQSTGKKLVLKYVDLPSVFSATHLKLDTTGNTIYMAGSLDVNFGKKLTTAMSEAAGENRITIVGMPTWDAIKDFKKTNYKNLKVIYSAPFYFPNTSNVTKGIYEYFKTNLYARPSDMVFRGYEVMWKYGKLLMQYKKDLASNIGRKDFQVFTPYDIQPVINRSTTVLDYYENKNLYFLAWEMGKLGIAY